MKRNRKKRYAIAALCLTAVFAAACSANSSKNEEGLALYKEGAYSEAVAAFKEAVAQDNTEPEYYVNLGMALIETGDYAGAIQNFDYALSISPEYKYAYRGRGIASLLSQDYAGAIESFNNALANTDGKITQVEYDVLKYRAEAEAKSGDLEAAISTYTILLEVEESKTDDYFMRGRLYCQMGDFEKARADFDEAVKLNSSDYQLYWNIYDALSSAGQEEAGKEYLRQALVISDEKDSAHKYRGIIQYLLGEYDSAVVELTAVQDTQDSEVLLYLGMTYEAQGNDESAMAVYNSALSLDASNSMIYNQLGVYHMKKGEYQEALTCFQNGLTQGDGKMNRELSYNEAVAYEYLGDFATAREKLQAYADTYGTDEAVTRELEFLSTR